MKKVKKGDAVVGGKLPIHRLKKQELIWMSNNKCKHSHTYLSHYNCYLQEKPNKQRIGHFDIEASNLDADYGIMLSYAIKEHGTDKIYKDVITKKDINSPGLDKRIVQNCIKDIQKFDRIVGFYSTKFDIPFIRTRALIHNLDFPKFKSILHTDMYYYAKHRLKLSSNRLENVCRNLMGDSNKTRIDSKYWVKALRGDKKSLDYILDHNIKDVIDLERVFNKLINFGQFTDKSI